MYVTTGYNAISCLMGAVYIDEHGSSNHGGLGTGYETLPRYLFISATNFFAFFSCLGAITVTLWARELIETIQQIASLKFKGSDIKTHIDLKQNHRIFYVTIILLFAQAVVFEIFLNTLW